MKVIFLCGGTGKRMFPLSGDKFLLDFLGKTLFEHQIEVARKAGLAEFVIVGNPRNINRIEDIVSKVPGIKAELALQAEPRGIADTLESASHLLSGEIIVVNPNDVFEASAYTRLLEVSRAETASSCLIGYEVADYFPGGYLVASEDGDLTHIVEKPEKGTEPSNLVNILIHQHREPKTLLEYIASVETKRDDAYELAIGAMARDSHRIKVVPYSGRWETIKYPWHILAVTRQFLDQSHKYISPSADISDKATIDGEVIIGDNARVLENAVIRGPAYIGPNTVIGNSCLIREYSHIGANCVVGYSTEIKNSYIGDECWFHMSYIGDSIIGNRCSFGAGTVLANFRFDESNISVKIDSELIDTGRNKFGAIIGDDSKTGVNASVMPGVKIGPSAIVGSHACLTEDLERDTMLLIKPVYKTVRTKPLADG